MHRSNTKNRLNGLDLARCIALLGMVLVNFRLAMAAESIHESNGFAALTTALEGKAAALFVILAGISITLSTKNIGPFAAQKKIVRRAFFLFLVGMLNVTIFSADIIHYYAIYFILGALCLRFSSTWLLLFIPLLSLTSVLLTYILDFDTGWNWQTLSYRDFWTFNGFMRNLWFNGFHPVLPWLAFLLFGLYLGRLPLNTRKMQYRLLYTGLSIALLTTLISHQLTRLFDYHDLSWIFSSSPIPPAPFYLVLAGSTATATIGFCLLLCQSHHHVKFINWLLPAGRQTLTLYMMHIILGMGTLEYARLLNGQSLSPAIFTALFYFFCAVIFSNIWSKFFRYGLLESIMAALDKRQKSS